ncbi:MAG: DUF2970 domain-containing protein [Rubrivivax sp.]|nr:MAG: DUF2970 domain-containing protein [Rubrivivax sp.]
MSGSGQDFKNAVGRKASFGQTISAIAWGFFGVRRGRDHENDVAKLNPVHVIIAGLLGAALLVLVLVLLISWVISSGVAGA